MVETSPSWENREIGLHFESSTQRNSEILVFVGCVGQVFDGDEATGRDDAAAVLGNVLGFGFVHGAERAARNALDQVNFARVDFRYVQQFGPRFQSGDQLGTVGALCNVKQVCR